MFNRLTSDRLTLRPVCEDDAQLIFTKWAQDTDITNYMLWTPHKSILETQEYVSRCLEDWGNDNHSWIIEVTATGEAVGSFAARVQQHKVDVGYLIVKKCWGRGYMTELLKAFVYEVFKDEIIQRVWAVCDVDNMASKRVLEKSGMEYEGLLKSWSVQPNLSAMPRDCHCLSVVNTT